MIVLAPVCKNLKSVLFRALLKKFRRHPLSAMYAGVLFSGGRGSCPMLAVGPECAWLLLLTAWLSMGSCYFPGARREGHDALAVVRGFDGLRT